MKRYGFLLWLVLGISAVAWGEIRITPPEPTTSNEVYVTISFMAPTGGYGIDDVAVRRQGRQFWMDVYLHGPAPGAVVTQATELHEHTESLGRLGSGPYTVHVTYRGLEHPDESASFTVSPSGTDGDGGGSGGDSGGATPSPTGRIAFGRKESGNVDIYTVNPDGTNMVRVTKTDDLWESCPRWSPDGTKMAFVRSAGQGQNPDIWVMNADGSGQVNVTNTPDVWEEWPFWSPDGQKVGCTTWVGSNEIHVMNTDGTGRTILTQGHLADWSPDGTWIIFDRPMTPTEPIGHGQLFVMNADGTNVQRVTYSNLDDSAPAWSPDGTRIVFSSTRNGDYLREQVYVADFVVDADGNAQLLNQTNITADEWRWGLPRWSPDGTQIVVGRCSPNTWQTDLRIMNADGSSQLQLTNTPDVIEGAPDWGLPASVTPVEPDPGVEPVFGTPEWFEWWRQERAPESLPDPPVTMPTVPSEPGFGSPEWFEQWRQEHLPVNPADPADGLPGFEVIHKPWSDVSSVKEGISKVSITPAEPTSESEVCATVWGWKSDSRCEVDYTEVHTAGRTIWLDVYWHVRPTPMPTMGSPGTQSQQNAIGEFSQAQSGGTVTVYDLTPFEGAPYQVKQSLGTFAPGAYTLHVVNHGPVPGSASTTFIVRDAASPIAFKKQGDENAWSWLLSH